MQSTDNENDLLNQEINNNETELIKNCKTELEQIKNSFVMLSADFDNYKKRTIKEKDDLISKAQSDLLLNLLSIVDDFDRALAENKKQDHNNNNTWNKGYELIHKALYKFLEKYGVKEINNYNKFDPEYHEAIAQVSSDQHTPGDIVNVTQKGFMFKNRVLRPATVIVAK